MKVGARKVIFWVLIVGGVALIISGIFVPALAVAGGALVATAAVVGSGLVHQEHPDRNNAPLEEYHRPAPEVLVPSNLDESYAEPPDISVTFQFRNRRSRHLPDQPEYESDIESDRKERCEHHKHRDHP